MVALHSIDMGQSPHNDGVGSDEFERLKGRIVYDIAGGDYAKVVEHDGMPALATPDGDDVFVEYDQWIDWDEEVCEFIPIPRKAVDHPDEYIETFLENEIPNTHENEGLHFAMERIEIVESEE